MNLPPKNSWELLPPGRKHEPAIDGMKRVLLKRKGKSLSTWSRWFLIGAIALSVQTTYCLTVDGDLSVETKTHVVSRDTGDRLPIEKSVTVFLTSTGSHTYTIPGDWSDSNTIACVGGGGNGGGLRASAARATGGGGGAYSASTLTGYSPGDSISYSVGAAGADTWFSSTGTLLAKGGADGNTATSGTLSGATGGQASSGVGTTKRSGGDGGDLTSTFANSGTGGGGAGGQHGDGVDGSSTSSGLGSTAGGRGDSTSGGTGGASGGTNGSAGTNFDASHGSGGGGGGNFGTSGAISAGDGGLYGGGGGGAVNSNSSSGSATGGSGAQGIIWITYTATPSPTVTSVSPSSGSTSGNESVTITGTNFTNASAVKFDTLSATSVVVVNATMITCLTPAHAAGLVDVSVTTPPGTGTGTDKYTYLSSGVTFRAYVFG